MKDDILIRFEKVSKKYNRNVWGLIDSDLSISKNRITVFIGKNGAGKTTTIKLILGLIYPTHGNIFIKNKDTKKLNSNENIGFLPERIDFPELMSVDDVINNLAKIRNVDKDYFNQKYIEYLNYFEIIGSEKNLTMNLSKGMRQKVGIIQAIIHNPDILILDEPTSGLDPIAKKKLFDLIKKFKDEGKTIIISSHRIDEIEAIADNIVFFNENKIIKQTACKSITDGNSYTIFKMCSSINDGLLKEALKNELEGLEEIEGDTVIIRNNPSFIMNDVISVFYKHGLAISNISVKASSIEDYYLNLIDSCNTGIS